MPGDQVSQNSERHSGYAGGEGRFFLSLSMGMVMIMEAASELIAFVHPGERIGGQFWQLPNISVLCIESMLQFPIEK